MNSFRNLTDFSTVNKVLYTLFRKQEICPNYIQMRYAARKGKRAKMLAEKMKRKLAEASKPKPPPTPVFRKSRHGVIEHRRVVDENWIHTKPVDNVWRTALYRGRPYTLEDAVSMHRETHHSSMLNAPDAFIRTTIEMDLRMKKANQYLDPFRGVITYPHEFETASLNKVIVLCKSGEDEIKATDAGAVYVGGTSLIKQILSGQISSEEFDYVVCHPDIYKECNVLRGILKKNYPSAYNGLLRLDVDKAVTTFSKGVKYFSEQSAVELDFGWINVCFGRLSMPFNFLEENFKYLLNEIEKYKPQGREGIPFITKTLLWCDQTTEKFKVSHTEYCSEYEQEEISEKL